MRIRWRNVFVLTAAIIAIWLFRGRWREIGDLFVKIRDLGTDQSPGDNLTALWALVILAVAAWGVVRILNRAGV